MDAQLLYFSWVDYLVLVGLLCISIAVGIYYGCFGTKQNTTEQYLHGGKKMKPIPIALSLTASHVSGITLLGIPAEVYLFGTQYMVFPITVVWITITILCVFLPVYYKLQLSSSFEYLKMRFGHGTRSLASCLYILSTILYVPIVIYVPALALNQVTGISVHVISPLICAVCIFYTTLGGLKAVVISDTIQFSITFLTMATIFVIGTYLSGGFVSIWEKAESRNRIEFFNMNLDPTVRETFWAIVIGMGVTFIGNLGINPSSIQRFLSLPTYRDAQMSVVIFGVGTIITKLVSSFIGLIMFARYIDCDPLSNGSIKSIDQLLPFYMLDALGNLKGFPGLFVASVLCTALSTMSTSINTLALTIYEDFLKSKLPKNTSQNTINIVIKSIVVATGIIGLMFIFLIEKLGGVLQIGLSFHGLTLGPLVGLNVLGALVGGICSLVLTGVLVVGAQIYTLQGRMKPVPKSLSTSGCSFLNDTFVRTTTAIPEVDFNTPPGIFTLSHYFYSVVGMMLVIVIGLFVSWLTKSKDEPAVHRELLSPCIYRFLSKDEKHSDFVLYETVEKALIRVQSVKEEKSITEVLGNDIKS
ncbi:hypothetical protein RN001_015483 [Aquatica leii]|uniref:Sodium-coupled monocarboxylate transporter 1 n=1 Tax=Aquatica leii TaxID=1421715 RepID=A0AAN7PPR9_9COLE|nr:hypothetical protein RN001_015483 [Aquatica leii]